MCRRRSWRGSRRSTPGAGASLAVDTNRPDPTVIPLGPSGGGGLFSTAMDYARFCEMLLQGGQFNGVRLLAPRTVEMMRTNHVNPDPLKTMPPGTGWGMDFQVVTDAAAAGEAVPTGTFSWFGIAGTWFWIDPVNGPRVCGDGAAPESRDDAGDPCVVAESGVSGGGRLAILAA